jgi:hypothetical protein
VTRARVWESSAGSQTTGTTWLNRTATLSGTVFKEEGVDYSVTAIFDAFAGTTKVYTQTRTSRGTDPTMSIGFTIGDPNLVGGIDRIRLQICENDLTPPFCGVQQKVWR